MRLVVKIGTSTLTHKGGHLNIRRVTELVSVLSDLKNAGHELVIVSSGAIAMGISKLGLLERPTDVATFQAVSAVGQCSLMYVYDKLFTEHNHVIGQILITGSDLENEERGQNFHNTLFRLLEIGTIPIINENDTIGTDEILIGDNDTLSAYVARTIEADLLVMLTDIDGLYTEAPNKNPIAQFIPVVEKITPEIEALASGAGTKFGTGGMRTKIVAAKIATCAGIETIITNGNDPKNLYLTVEGNTKGTRFLAVSDFRD